MIDRFAAFARALRLEPGGTALIVVDMQRGFVEPGQPMEVPPAREIVPAIRALLHAFRARRLPVGFSEFTSPSSPGGHVPSADTDDVASTRTIEALAPHPGELVVRKRWYDAFGGTQLDAWLRARGVTSLVITGTMTDVCVLSTVVGAFNRDYRVSVVEDGVATLWPDIQRATLDIVSRAFGRVVQSKEVLDIISSW
jgi:ureidoacrylate peracid hydrolase